MFQNKLYYMMNKPGGCITARSDASHRTVMEYFPEELAGELFPVGRLDKDTQGLLLFTNDGSFDQRIMHPKHHAPKKYYLFATGSLSAGAAADRPHRPPDMTAAAVGAGRHPTAPQGS